jgi:F0F1-type ATP synthase membrane subunit c/vacuolar-type H+-ATPase subunit K
MLCAGQGGAFVLFAFIGAPMSQTIYGMILMGWINTALDASLAAHQAINWGGMLGAGIFGGLGMGVSAWYQGVIGAAAADAMAETGKGFGNYLMTLGIIETLAILVLVFIPPAFRLAGGGVVSSHPASAVIPFCTAVSVIVVQFHWCAQATMAGRRVPIARSFRHACG